MGINCKLTNEQSFLINKVCEQGYIYTLFEYWGPDGEKVYDKHRVNVDQIIVRYTRTKAIVKIIVIDYTVYDEYYLEDFAGTWWLNE